MQRADCPLSAIRLPQVRYSL